ncbi:putative ATP-dependent helicase YprA-like [Hordeum vulgare]|nr:putative ATP-dependent helicase YprA-like [Hordeum vulgare]
MEQSKLWFRGELHGVAHAILSILPLHMMCGSGDLDTECVDPQETRNGLAAQARMLFGDLLAVALELVSACGCGNSDGCPNCVQSFACRDTNKNLDKVAAMALLKGLIQWHSELKPN